MIRKLRQLSAPLGIWAVTGNHEFHGGGNMRLFDEAGFTLLRNRWAQVGAGLMLSGHTHGGQIWPFDYLSRRAYPLLEGRYEVDGMTVIVCRGTGTWGPRMRLWHPGEILRVTLRGKKKPITDE